MNGRNMGTRPKGVRYRNTSYAKKRAKVIIIIVAVVLAVVALTLLIVGNILRANSEDKHEKPMGNENDTVVDAGSDVPSVNGYAMSLAKVNSGDTAVSTYVTRARNLGGNAISFAARDASGNELYSSELARSMGKQTAGSVKATLRDIDNRAGALRISAGVNVSALGEKSDIYRSVLLAYDAGICAELYAGGADDVFIRITKGSVNSDSAEALMNFAQSVKNIDGTAVLGLALTDEFFGLADADTLIDRLSDKYDFLLLDLTNVKAGSDVAEYVKSSVDAAQLYVMMYEMRVLLPEADEETTEAMITALTAKSIDNWQVYIP